MKKEVVLMERSMTFSNNLKDWYEEKNINIKALLAYKEAEKSDCPFCGVRS